MPGGMTRPIGVKPEGSKVDRVAAQSAKIEAGHVYLPKSAVAQPAPAQWLRLRSAGCSGGRERG
jgi:phage terminase large subunit-like protein